MEVVCVITSKGRISVGPLPVAGGRKCSPKMDETIRKFTGSCKSKVQDKLASDIAVLRPQTVSERLGFSLFFWSTSTALAPY